MPNQTLPPFSQKTETRKDPSRAPGAMGWINESLELIAGGGGSFVNEKPLTEERFQNLMQTPEHKEGMPVRGSIEFNSQSPAQVTPEKSIEEMINAKRVEINTKIGGIGNVLFEDTVSKTGEVRTDVQTHLDRKNSELTAEQLKASREIRVTQATGKIDRIAGADMKRTFEDQNMAGPG